MAHAATHARGAPAGLRLSLLQTRKSRASFLSQPGSVKFKAIVRGSEKLNHARSLAVDHHLLFVAATLHAFREQEGELQSLIRI